MRRSRPASRREPRQADRDLALLAGEYGPQAFPEAGRPPGGRPRSGRGFLGPERRGSPRKHMDGPGKGPTGWQPDRHAVALELQATLSLLASSPPPACATHQTRHTCVSGTPHRAQDPGHDRTPDQRRHDALLLAAARRARLRRPRPTQRPPPVTVIVTTTLAGLHHDHLPRHPRQPDHARRNTRHGQALTAGGSWIPMGDLLRLGSLRVPLPHRLRRSRSRPVAGSRPNASPLQTSVGSPRATTAAHARVAVPGYLTQAHHLEHDWAADRRSSTSLGLCPADNRMASQHGWTTNSTTPAVSVVPPPELNAVSQVNPVPRTIRPRRLPRPAHTKPGGGGLQPSDKRPPPIDSGSGRTICPVGYDRTPRRLDRVGPRSNRRSLRHGGWVPRTVAVHSFLLRLRPPSPSFRSALISCPSPSVAAHCSDWSASATAPSFPGPPGSSAARHFRSASTFAASSAVHHSDPPVPARDPPRSHRSDPPPLRHSDRLGRPAIRRHPIAHVPPWSARDPPPPSLTSAFAGLASAATLSLRSAFAGLASAATLSLRDRLVLLPLTVQWNLTVGQVRTESQAGRDGGIRHRQSGAEPNRECPRAQLERPDVTPASGEVLGRYRIGDHRPALREFRSRLMFSRGDVGRIDERRLAVHENNAPSTG